MDKQLTVLITRPQPGARAFADMLPGMTTVLSPMMVIKPVAADLGAPDVVIITSRHAIGAVADLKEAPLCYCVGDATATAARAAGLRALPAGETARQVADRVISDHPEGRILYARGRHVAFDMVGALQQAGLHSTQSVVYDQQDAPLTPQAKDLLLGENPVIVPLFSARSAALFFEVCPHDANLRLIAISQSVAKSVPETHKKHLKIAPNPDASSMAKTVQNVGLGGKRLEQGR